MDKRVQNLKSSSTFSRPIGLDTKTWRYVEPILEALQQAQHQTGRFRFYGYLAAVYRTFKEWKDLGISKRMTRHVIKYFKIPHRRGASPARTLIDATFPGCDPKQKSRWSRALEFAALTKVTPNDLPRLFKNSSGIAGCACLAAKQKPRKNTYRDDWV
jgi:transposase